MQDLAAMPFGTDAEAASFLGGNPEYGEVASNAKLLESLFSSEDRKERHEKDVAEGVPPPPDPEYREEAIKKEKIAENKRIESERKQKIKAERERIEAAQRRISAQNKNKKTTGQVRPQKETTRPANFNPSNGISSHGGGGGTTTGTTWAYQDKKIDTKNNSMPLDHAMTAKDEMFAKGRSGDLYRVGKESKNAENALTAEKAASGAIDAFQNGEVQTEGVEDDKNELNFDGELPTVDPNLKDDIKRAINDDIKNEQNSKKNSSDTAKGKEYSINENCMDSNGHINRECRKAKFYDKLFEFGFKIGEAAFNHFVLGGGSSGGSSVNIDPSKLTKA
ncbi:MAG: hypothetical protein J5601_03500 [Elusimicrobiaceae bacterium]|nr:hypothetical protein [Elusimicrobiaceae bacterium]